MAWDKEKIAEGVLAPDLNDEIRANWAALEAALDTYAYFATGGVQTGRPRPGSARPYFQDAAPTARLDGDYFTSDDYGTVWIDSNTDPDNQFNILTAADGAGTETWTPISTEVIAVMVAAAHTWALTQTFSVPPAFTLGATLNNAYLTAKNAAGDGTVDLIKADGSDVPTVPDDTANATSGAPTADASLANKLYVDNRRAYIKLVDSKAAGTNGGTFTSGDWRKRTVTEETDTGNNCAVSSSVIVLGAGTYECRISCPAYDVHAHQTRLRNTTTSTTIAIGTIEFADVGAEAQTRSFIVGRFTIAAAQDLEIQHRCEDTNADDGLGIAGANLGENAVYTIAEFWKI